VNRWRVKCFFIKKRHSTTVETCCIVFALMMSTLSKLQIEFLTKGLHDKQEKCRFWKDVWLFGRQSVSKWENDRPTQLHSGNCRIQCAYGLTHTRDQKWGHLGHCCFYRHPPFHTPPLAGPRERCCWTTPFTVPNIIHKYNMNTFSGTFCLHF